MDEETRWFIFFFFSCCFAICFHSPALSKGPCGRTWCQHPLLLPPCSARCRGCSLGMRSHGCWDPCESGGGDPCVPMVHGWERGALGWGTPRSPRTAAFGYRGDCATAGGLCSRRKVTCHFSIHLSPSCHLSITHSHQPGEIPGALGVPRRSTPRRGDPQLGEDPRCRLCPRAVIFSQTDGLTDGDTGSPCVPALLCRGSAILRGAGHKSRGHS